MSAYGTAAQPSAGPLHGTDNPTPSEARDDMHAEQDQAWLNDEFDRVMANRYGTLVEVLDKFKAAHPSEYATFCDFVRDDVAANS